MSTSPDHDEVLTEPRSAPTDGLTDTGGSGFIVDELFDLAVDAQLKATEYELDATQLRFSKTSPDIAAGSR